MTREEFEEEIIERQRHITVVSFVLGVLIGALGMFIIT